MNFGDVAIRKLAKDLNAFVDEFENLLAKLQEDSELKIRLVRLENKVRLLKTINKNRNVLR